MAVGRTYDDGPDPDTVWIDLYDTWRAESAWEHEPNPVEHSTARGDAWDVHIPLDLGDDALTFGDRQ